MELNELAADDVVKAFGIWCDGAKTIMHADHADSFLGSNKRD